MQDEVNSLVDASTVVDELTEADVDESLGLSKFWTNLNISHGMMLLT